MKRIVCLVGVLLSCSFSSFAQLSGKSSPPKFQFFAGYSRELIGRGTCGVSFSTGTVPPHCMATAGGPGTSDLDHYRPTSTMNGFELSAIYNFNKYVGLKADFSAHFKKELVVSKDVRGINESVVDTRLYQYMVGPELKIPNDSIVTPFGYALLGGAYSSRTITSLVNASDYSFGFGSGSKRAFTKAIGGGFDLRLSQRTSVRYAIDFNPTRARMYGPLDTPNNVRFSIGILFN